MVLRIGLSSLFLLGKPFEVLRRYIQRSQVQFWEIVDEDTHRLNRARIEILKDLRNKRELNLVVHAPFADINVAAFNRSIREFILRRLTQSIRNASQIGAEFWVFHPGLHSGLSWVRPEEDWQINMDSISSLCAFAEKLGVEPLIENMPAPLHFMLRTAKDFERFYSCHCWEKPEIAFDVGHANTVKQVETFLDKHWMRIRHVHVHDNFGEFDQHNVVGEGTVDWLTFASKISRKDACSIVIESFLGAEKSLRKLRSLLSQATSSRIKS